MRRRRFPAALAAGLLLAGCVGQPVPRKTRYVLEVTPVQVMDPGARGVVQVNRVRVASLFERKGLVYRTGADRYEADFYHEFYSPPGELIRHELGEWLERSGVFHEVVAPSMSGRPDWWLEGNVTALYADLRRPARPEAVFEATWALVDPRSPQLAPTFEKSYRSVVALPDREPASVVDGFRTALITVFDQLSRDLAGALDAGPALEEEGARP